MIGISRPVASTTSSDEARWMANEPPRPEVSAEATRRSERRVSVVRGLPDVQVRQHVIDGEVVDSGVPEGAYPSWTPAINWRARAAWEGNVTQWDFIRYGTIPLDASGDFDSDGDLDRFDYRYFLECYHGRGFPNDPGCRWADLDSDGDVDDADLSAFLDRYLQKVVAVRISAP